MRAIKECSFQRPSEVQYNTIPNALTGKDILCQAKAGSGKTAVFVLSILNQFNKETPAFSALVVCHTRELALQIKKEFIRLGRYLTFLKVKEFVGGIDIKSDKDAIRDEQPHVVVGTPGRILDLVKGKHLKLDKIKYMVVDECDKVLSSVKMRADVQEIFLKTPHEKQVMMFSGTMREEDKVICRKFMQEPIEITVEDNSKLVLNGLKQFYVSLMQKDKIAQLLLILEHITYNQVIIFVNKKDRAIALSEHLKKKAFNNETLHRDLDQE